MTVSLFTFVDLYSRALTTAEHLLAKGRAHARAQGIDEAEILGWRLVEDMQPLAFQLSVLINFSRQWPARVAGIEVPPEVGDDLSLDGFVAAMAEARAWLAARTEAEFAGRDEVPLTFMIGNGMEPTLPSGQWLSVFVTTNFYFHLSTAYGILRAKGVPIGKPDLFAGGL